MMDDKAALKRIIEGMKASVGEDCGLKKTVKFEIEGAGPVYIDASRVPNEVSSKDAPADCTVKVSLENFLKLVGGEANATGLFMTGKLKVSGDMGTAMKLGSVLKPAK